MHFVIINIGSNLGARRMNLSRAMAAVGREFGDFELSHVVESEPWGYDSENKFLNVGMTFTTDRAPYAILAKLKEIEREISPGSHRKEDGSYADRYIDIDIIAIDGEVIEEADLKIPHQHLADRDFFLVPLEELAPGWRHPKTGKTATEMLSELEKRKAKL